MTHRNLPYRHLEQNHMNTVKVQNEINKIINSHLDDWVHSNQENELDINFLEPNIEVINTSDTLRVSAELPGLNANDIDIQLSEEGFLTISGEKKHQSEEETDGFYFSERSYGHFQRTIHLPTNEINREKITAEFDKGVLNITLPKSGIPKKNTKKIAIKSK